MGTGDGGEEQGPKSRGRRWADEQVDFGVDLVGGLGGWEGEVNEGEVRLGQKAVGGGEVVNGCLSEVLAPRAPCPPSTLPPPVSACLTNNPLKARQISPLRARYLATPSHLCAPRLTSPQVRRPQPLSSLFAQNEQGRARRTRPLAVS
jgi:hypothetical protein